MGSRTLFSFEKIRHLKLVRKDLQKCRITNNIWWQPKWAISRFKCNSMPNSLTNKPLNLSLPEDNRPTPMLWRLGGLLIPEPTIWMLISVWLVSLTLRDEGARSPRKFYLNSWRACKTMRTVRRSTISCTWPFQELELAWTLRSRLFATEVFRWSKPLTPSTH